MSINSSNYNYRSLINRTGIGNHTIFLSSSKPSSITATFSKTMNQYWKFRILSDTSLTIQPAFGDDVEIYNGGGGWNISSPNALDNLIGSRWAISGGSNECIAEIYVQQGGPTHSPLIYFSWDTDPGNSTYILCQFQGDSGTNSVSWVVDNIVEKYQTFDSNTPVFRIYWDRNTKLSEVRIANFDGPGSDQFNNVVGTYSINNSNDPCVFYSWRNGYRDAEPSIFIWRYIVSNHGGRTQSLFYNFTHNPPPTTYMMDQDDKY